MLTTYPMSQPWGCTVVERRLSSRKLGSLRDALKGGTRMLLRNSSSDNPLLKSEQGFIKTSSLDEG